MARGAWLARLVALMVLTVCGTACQKFGPDADPEMGTTRPVPESRAENDWPLYKVPKEGFALTLPPEWRQFDMDPATFEAKFRDALKMNPEIDEMAGTLRQQLAAGVKFFGFDEKTRTSGFATNINVLRMKLPPKATLDTTVAESLKELKALSSVTKPVDHERVKTTAGECERFRYTLRMQVASGKTIAFSITQFLFVTSDTSFVVTLTTSTDKKEKYAETFDKIGQSFRWIMDDDKRDKK
jgi:hypothetical protein